MARGKSLKEAAKLAQKNDWPLLAVGTVNSHINKLNAFLNYAVDEDYINKNLAKKLTIQDPVKKKHKRDPFNDDASKEIEKHIKTTAGLRKIPIHPELKKIGFLEYVNSKQEKKSGKLVYTTENSYSRLKEVFWAFGAGVIRTKTEGVVILEDKIVSIKATVDYEYDDTFTDPFSMRQLLLGTSSLDKAPSWFIKLTDVGGTPFRITDKWQTSLTGSVELEEED